MSQADSPSVADLIQAQRAHMTRSESQLADLLLDDYPMAGLGSITELADRADVSTPTVGRMVQKLGFGGYPAFQARLRAELAEMISGPVAKHDTWRSPLPDDHILKRYTAAALDNQRMTAECIDPAAFDAFCALLADSDRRVFIAGGRITSTLANYLYLHLQMIRPDVRLLPSDASWPHDLLDLCAGDVFVAFDVRRYENSTLLMAQMAHEQKAEVVLFTDPWRSPIHRLARHCFTGRIKVPSAWDSGLSLLLLVECTIAAMQEALWERVEARSEALEQAFDRTKLFRKFT